MPEDNNFCHSKYSRSDPGGRATYLTLEEGAQPYSPAWNDALGLNGKTLYDSGVRVVLLLYGSYISSDIFGSARLDEIGGLKRGYSRGISGLESLLALLRPGDYQKPKGVSTISPPFVNDKATKAQLDELVGDKGNFTATYQHGLEDAISSSGSTPITCVRHLWSSLHHHLGRVEATFDLLHELIKLQHTHNLNENHRILIVAHGQAGQLPALLSNFLEPEESTVRDEIFEILGPFYSQGDDPRPAMAHAQELDQFLANRAFDTFPTLDIVTLGTSVRYGWNTSGIGKLLHLINHRPIRRDGKTWLAKMDLPQIVMEMPMLLGGDYVHQLGVASTGTIPTTPIEEEINQSLQENLEPFDGFERWLECAKRVTRCPNDGQCLLVDYQDTGEVPVSEHLFGHACYTRDSSILFQFRQIVNALYK